MAIRVITGNPGSGKTYYAMYHILKKWFERDKILGEFLPRGDVALVTNIDEIGLNCYSLNEMVGVAGGVKNFFTVEYQKKLLVRMNRIVYIIDEAGQWFGRDMKDDKVLFFFQYHRHLGLDFYLILPSTENLNRGIVVLAEYVIHARSRGARLLGSFVYDKMFAGEKAGAVSIPAKKEIFRLYKSMQKAEGEKIRSFTRRYLVLAVITAILAGVIFFGSIRWFMTGGRNSKRSVAHASKAVVAEKVIDNKVENVKVETVVAKKIDEKGGPGGLREVVFQKDIVSSDTSGHVRVHVTKSIDGGDVVYSEDGRYFGSWEIRDLMRSCVIKGGEVFIPRLKSGRSSGRTAGGERTTEGRLPELEKKPASSTPTDSKKGSITIGLNPIRGTP